MKKKINPFIILAIVVTLGLISISSGCESTTNDTLNTIDEVPDLQLIAAQMDALDTALFKNIRAEYRSRNKIEKRLMITNFYRNQNGFVWLLLNEKHVVQSTNYEYCTDSSFFPKAEVEKIGIQVDKLGYWVVSMDSFANVYLSLQKDRYNYALIRDSSNIWQNFKYQLEFDNFYRMKEK